jgi:hypothetical protein
MYGPRAFRQTLMGAFGVERLQEALLRLERRGGTTGGILREEIAA